MVRDYRDVASYAKLQRRQSGLFAGFGTPMADDTGTLLFGVGYVTEGDRLRRRLLSAAGRR